MQINRLVRFLNVRMRTALVFGAVVCGTSLGALLTDAAYSNAREGAPVAKEAHVESVSLKMNLEITSIKGNNINAQGEITGKFQGSVYLKLNLVNASRAVASFVGYNARGKLIGSGGAGYRVSGSISYFTGGNPSLSGTGKYAGTKSDGMSMTGMMNRRTLKISVNLQGKLISNG